MIFRFFALWAKSAPQAVRPHSRPAGALIWLALAAAPLFAAGANEFPVLRLGIEGRLDGLHDLTLTIASDTHGREEIAKAIWPGSQIVSSQSGAPSVWPRIYAALQPETVYYLHARSSKRTAGQVAQVLLDPPPGYTLEASAHFSEGLAILPLRYDGSSVCMLRLIRNRQEALPAGAALPPAIGPDSLLEISLGNLPNKAPAGWIRVKKSALLTGDFSRDMLQLRKDFKDISAIYDKARPSRIAFYKTDHLEVRFADLPADQGLGCVAAFYEQQENEWAPTLTYTFKPGASDRELIIAKEEGGKTSQIAFTARTQSMARVSRQDGISLKLEMGEMGAMGAPVTFAVVSQSYSHESIPTLRDGDTIYAISEIVYTMGNGERITRDNPNPTHDTLHFHYPDPGRYQGKVTALINEYKAEDGRYRLSSDPVVAETAFEVVVDDSVVWTILEEGRQRTTVERKTARTGEATNGLLWNVRDTVTIERLSDESGPAGTAPTWTTMDKAIWRYTFFDFGGNERLRIPPEHYGFNRYQTVLSGIEESLGAETFPAGNRPSTVYSYFNDPADPATFGKLKSVQSPSGGASYFSYDESLINGRRRHNGSSVTHVLADLNEAVPSTPEEAFQRPTFEAAK